MIERLKHGRRLFRKHVLRKDNRVVLTPVALRHIRRYDLAATEIVDAESVLDAACGSGYGKDVIGLGRHYVGVDLDPEAIKVARRNYGDVFQRGSVTALDLPDASFDAIVSFETLEHLTKPEQALTEFGRILRPGGKLVGSIPLNHPDLVYHARVYRFSDVRRLIDRSEFAVVRLLHQRHVAFRDIEAVDDAENGTLIFVLARHGY